jgi:predicted nucleic-acid-binding protein
LQKLRGGSMPLAIDTNVLMRSLVDDGSEQARRSRDRFSSGRVFVSSSVLLETEWVLRSSLKFTSRAINQLFSFLAGLDHVELENRPAILRAIAAHGQGMDFADATHLFAASHCDAFCSFDADFRRRASKIEGAIDVVAP